MADLKRGNTLTHKITRIGVYEDITVFGNTDLMEICISTADGQEIRFDLEAAQHLETAVYEQHRMLKQALEAKEQANG